MGNGNFKGISLKLLLTRDKLNSFYSVNYAYLKFYIFLRFLEYIDVTGNMCNSWPNEPRIFI